MNNAAKTLARLWFAKLESYARANTKEGDEGNESQWTDLRDWCEHRAVALTQQQNSTYGDTWSLSHLGYTSPSYIVGLCVLSD